MAGRFAPSTTGAAHPGTLLAGLLAWLDARSRGLPLVLRLDDADPQRCREACGRQMLADLRWFGLDWDVEQSKLALRGQQEAALDQLAEAGLLYACTCSRSCIRATARPAPGGAWRYPGTCRERRLGPDTWRRCGQAVRLCLPDRAVHLMDENGRDLGGHPLEDFGDPVVVRRDGGIAYQLSVVVDDAVAGVSRVVRGRDLAALSAGQALLYDLLDRPRPVYRHHLLLLEQTGEKLSKSHGAIALDALRSRYDGPALVGILAAAAGLGDGRPCRPVDLLPGFSWDRVIDDDQGMHWDGRELGFSRHREPGP